MHDIRREKHPRHLVIIARPVVIQPRERVVVLPGEAFGGVDGALRVARIAIGPKHLVALDGRDACRVTETGQHAAQRIGQVEGGLARVIQRAQQPASQGIVVQITFVPTTIEIAMLLQPKGIDGHGGTTAGGRTPQHAGARGIVDVKVLVLRTCVPTDKVIQEVVGECRGGAAVGTAGDVAPAIVTAGVDLSRLVGASGTSAVETGQLVWLAVAVEILLLRPTATERAVPQLIQVRVDIAVVVTGSAQAVAEGHTATGAIACPWLRAAVACPYEAILLVNGMITNDKFCVSRFVQLHLGQWQLARRLRPEAARQMAYHRERNRPASSPVGGAYETTSVDPVPSRG